MTVKFHSNLANLVIGRGILGGGFKTASAISIYSGVQPTAAEIIANWVNYNSANANFLAHYNGVLWSQPLNGVAKFCSITTFPTPVLANHNGEGTWCIVWPDNVTGAQAASIALPNAVFLIGGVTTMTGNGIVRFNPDTLFSTTVTKPIADGVISATLAV